MKERVRESLSIPEWKKKLTKMTCGPPEWAALTANGLAWWTQCVTSSSVTVWSCLCRSITHSLLTADNTSLYGLYERGITKDKEVRLNIFLSCWSEPTLFLLRKNISALIELCLLCLQLRVDFHCSHLMLMFPFGSKELHTWKPHESSLKAAKEAKVILSRNE